MIDADEVWFCRTEHFFIARRRPLGTSRTRSIQILFIELGSFREDINELEIMTQVAEIFEIVLISKWEEEFFMLNLKFVPISCIGECKNS